MSLQDLIDKGLEGNPRFTYGVLLENLFGDLEHLKQNLSNTDRKMLLEKVKEFRSMK